ncbi:MAG: siroheme synthase, partial [Proteobacteria bacterium]|nr:siroheme synthase [Pseudomonadota bacterium]
MDYLPIFLDLRDQPCLVVGGGEVAARKTAMLLRAGARVSVRAPTLASAFDAWLGAGRVTHLGGVFQDGDLGEQALVIAATDDA